MGLPKGRTNNVNGRPAGSQNKELQDFRNFIKKFISDFNESGKFKRVFEKLSPNEKLKVYLDLMQYVTPKLQSVSNDISFGEQMPKIVITPAPDYEPIKETVNEN